MKLDPKTLYFLPLGGSNEIGMNLNLYAYGGKWLMADLGVSFGEETTPGVDVVMPDPAFIVERADQLAGLILTHAHEDHLGAVQYLWPRLRCPIWCTPFAAALLRAKLSETDLERRVPITVVPLGGRFQVGPFDIELISLTHSIPEPNAVVIRTGAGTVLHTGDWKLDPDPVVGNLADEVALRALGQEGVTALIGDSTNALVPGSSGSEAAVAESLIELFGRYPGRRIAVGCFASNVARLHSIARAAAAHGRQTALVGRSLWRIYEAARSTGYMEGVPPFLTEEEASLMPRDMQVLICTGSQGEPRAALSRIAQGEHQEIDLTPGDVVIFSSREIPGNEKSIARVQNALIRRGIEVVTSDDAFVHVSGHSARDELVQMYQWVRPRAAVPVHGEHRHLVAHAALARDCQVPEIVVPSNGSLIRLAPGPAEIIETIPTGKLGVDGNRVVPLGNDALRARAKMGFSGAAMVTVVLNGKGQLVGAPQLALMGLSDDPEDNTDHADAVDAVREAIAELPAKQRTDDVVREAARQAVRRSLNTTQGRKPMTQVHIVRIPEGGKA